MRWELPVAILFVGALSVCTVAGAPSQIRLAPTPTASSANADTPALTLLLETEAQLRSDVLNAANAEGYVEHAATASINDVLAQSAEGSFLS